MIIFDYKERVVKFIFCSILLIIVMLMLSKVFYVEENKLEYNEVVTSRINYKDDTTSIYAEYPRFNGNDEINKIISDNLYKYIREFKEYEASKALDITYNLFYIDNFVNIQYHIENTLNNIKNKNIFLDLNNNSISYITSIYDEDKFSNELYNEVNNKYDDLYKKIEKTTINNFTYIYDEDKLNVYFNDIEDIPYISIEMNTYNQGNDNKNTQKKYIAFTYDDGPSEYTSELLNYLSSYNSSATFFMIGSKMKGNESIVKQVYNSNSEVGSHSYSHKDLSTLKAEELNYELNSTLLIFNEITNSTINLLRPPYGKYSNNLLDKNYKIVTWSIDPKDWLVKDKDKIVSNVVKNACDGCIVLMHDTNKATMEATKELIPILNNFNYQVVSVSKLMQIKNYTNNNQVISKIK